MASSAWGPLPRRAPIANRDALVDGTPGADIYPELAPAPGEHVIKKHRYSGFFGTDLDIVLRGWGIDTAHVMSVADMGASGQRPRHKGCVFASGLSVHLARPRRRSGLPDRVSPRASGFHHPPFAATMPPNRRRRPAWTGTHSPLTPTPCSPASPPGSPARARPSTPPPSTV
ncbi:MAG: isochorismatase family protein [Acetobacteraceae bacterium]